MQPEFVEYQRQVLKNASTVAEELLKRGYNLVSGDYSLIYKVFTLLENLKYANAPQLLYCCN